MAELRLVHELREHRHLVFVVRETGEAVWARDELTGQEWWYVSAPGIEQLRPLVTRLLATEGSTVLLATPADDLAGQLPGHAVLARVQQLHEAATDVDGMPGVLDDAVTWWCVGFVGEERVGAALAALPPGWHVLHGVPVGMHADIDHVVVGPPGVVVVNTKHHQGVDVTAGTHTVFVAGQPKSYLRDIRADAARARSALGALDAPVHPVICLVGARRLRRSSPAEDVTVVASPLLVATLTALPARLQPAEVEAAYARLRRASSWTTRPPVPAAAPWVAEYARGLATEERLVKAHRRIRAPHPATPRRPTRRARRRWLSLLAAVLVLAGMFSLLLALPPLARLVTDGLTEAVDEPSAPPSAAPVSGDPCPTKGAEVTTTAGALVCKKASDGSLHWKAP